MITKLSAITLAVADLPAATAFYTAALGLATEGAADDHVVFELQGGLYLVLITRPGFAQFTDLVGRQMAPQGATGCALSHFTGNREAVDQILARAAAAGAAVVAASERQWGYAGYITDPDGHIWEIMHNPNLPTA